MNELILRKKAWCSTKEDCAASEDLDALHQIYVSYVILIKLVNLSGPHFPPLKCCHQGKFAQTSPQGMACFKL